MKAAIDIGSNSVRMLLGEVEQQGERAIVSVYRQYLRTTRLGQTPQGACLDMAAKERTLTALQEFQAILRQVGVHSLPLVAATSAVREAADGAVFAKEIKNRLGWDLQILSGEEEARLSFLGAASVATADVAVIDVGGGSTELICQTPAGLKGQSVPVGAVRLQQGEIKPTDLPDLLSPLRQILPAKQQLPDLVGVGGTITTVAAIKQNVTEYCRQLIMGTVVSKADLQQLQQELQPKTVAERLALYPILKDRADIILSGIEIYLALFMILQKEQIIVSDAGLLDGLLLSEV